MQLIPQAEFIARMQALGLTTEDAPSRLGFGRYEETDRFWLWPWPPPDLLGLLSAMIRHVVPETFCEAWRPGGVWHEDEPSFIDSIREHLLGGLSIPAGHSGALRFERGEFAAIAALMIAFAMGGWCVDDDVCLIPDHARYIIRLSHHAVVHVECREPGLVGPLVAHMEAEGYPLPTEVPDPTFKIPPWMASDAPRASA
jgi:hypothetical protein